MAISATEPLPPPATVAFPTEELLTAVRATVRAEMAVAHQAVQQTAMHAAAAQFVHAKVSGVQATWHAISVLLAVRLMLMLALLGGFALAVMAMVRGTYEAGGVLVAYAVLVLIPLIWLERNPRVGKPDAAP